MKLDLNCDLGEGEPLARTRALMSCITSANIACGGHAGGLRSMQTCVRLARESNVHIGAHPGPPRRADFGRGALAVTAAELEVWLLQQVSALERVVKVAGGNLHHIKLHGALYHATESNVTLARNYLATAKRFWPRTILFVRAGGMVARLARRRDVRVWEEAFADRGYQSDGSLVPRGGPGALLDDADQIARRLKLLRGRSVVETVDGASIRLSARTVCVHADSPGAVRTVRMAAAVLRG